MLGFAQSALITIASFLFVLTFGCGMAAWISALRLKGMPVPM